MEYLITTTVSGYYTDSTSNVPTVIEVADPTGTFITGGGYLVEANSAGSIPAANPSKMNFGFNVKYNSNGTNPQGHINIVYRSGGRVYQIKTTAARYVRHRVQDAPTEHDVCWPAERHVLGCCKLVVEGEPDRRHEPECAGEHRVAD